MIERDCMRFAEMLRNGGELGGVCILQPETVSLMIENRYAQLGMTFLENRSSES